MRQLPYNGFLLCFGLWLWANLETCCKSICFAMFPQFFPFRLPLKTPIPEKCLWSKLGLQHCQYTVYVAQYNSTQCIPILFTWGTFVVKHLSYTTPRPYCSFFVLKMWGHYWSNTTSLTHWVNMEERKKEENNSVQHFRDYSCLTQNN